jgi:23S rRNA pseudouridine1911/1915/1917 synthase
VKKLSLGVRPDDDRERLDRFLARAGSLTRGEARRLIDRGGVWVDGRRVKVASRQLRAGQSVTAVLQEGGRPADVALPAFGPERVLYEDDQLIAVDKPAFIPAQATLATDRGSLVSLVSKLIGQPAGLVHRLDLETSGVTVFCKGREATSALAAAFRERRARKRYLAVAWGALPDVGRVDLPLGRDPSRKGRFLAQLGARLPAATGFEVLGRRGMLVAVTLEPETGRTHQIRAHLKALGAPVVGDKLYGGPVEIETNGARIGVKRVLLHAWGLELMSPASGKAIRVAAPIPADLMEVLGSLAPGQVFPGADPFRVGFAS